MRFLGPKVYIGVVVVLVSAMRHGLSPRRTQALRSHLNIDRRTLRHWREWWQKQFLGSDFWKVARASFMPLVDESTLPAALCERFGVERNDRLLSLMTFLSPITGGRAFHFQAI